ncbi:hypothetical protein KK137_00065 [Croceibacterium sp. LX-88]|uniref:Flippase-like domain-containing protein n=1 Tax=Croceibacterium selenioxidans TaxID=2838833 RepID=A0ABS5W092_9SPHN|nr:hypothetical protein [Croceibacterium selenioxidans]MBT2132712.1 hypothetical protein [Croceibacterium selenioxidans]
MTDSRLLDRLMQVAGRAQAWAESPLASRIRKGFNALLSILILMLLARAIAQVGWHEVVAVVPASALFWILFVSSYLLQPFMEWFIYRHWWKFGWGAMGIFLRMRVMNDALFSYSGHTYLLVWAARRMGIQFDPQGPKPKIFGRGDGPGVDPAKNPFAAVKDMAITSGLAGNFATLVLLLITLTMDGASVLSAALDPRTLRILTWSFVLMILLNIGILVFRGKVMSLPVKENMFAFRWHLFRVLAVQALLVGSWAVALPGITFQNWFLLGALRMVIMRMPIPNKEILFAALAVSLTEDASVEVAALMAAQGALQLVFHALSWGAAAALEASAGQEDAPNRS